MLRALLFTAITVDAVIGTFVLTLILCTNRFDAFRRCPVVKRKQTRDVDFYHARHTALTTGAANQKFCSIFLHREIPPFLLFRFSIIVHFPFWNKADLCGHFHAPFTLNFLLFQKRSDKHLFFLNVIYFCIQIHTMKRAKTHIILFMAVTITVLYTVYIAFHNSAERVNTQIDHAFKSAITEDYNERLAYISYYHPEPTNWDIKMYTIAPSLHQKVKSYTIRTRQGKTIYTFKDSLDEQTAKRMLNQYILSQLKPIKPDELNATFRKILSDHGITGRTGTIYYNKSISQHSDQSSAIPRTAYNTPRYIVDITQNIKVQAWVNYDFKLFTTHRQHTLLAHRTIDDSYFHTHFS